MNLGIDSNLYIKNGIMNSINHSSKAKEDLIKGIAKYGLGEKDLPLLDKFMADPNSLNEEESKYFQKAIESAKSIPTPKTKMFYERFIQEIYSSVFWDRVARYAKYDMKYQILRDKLLNEDPNPNIILICGVTSDLGELDSNAEFPDCLDLPFDTCIIEATDKGLFNLPDNVGSDAQAMAIVELNPGYGFVVVTEDGQHVWAVDPTKDNYKMCMAVAQDLCRFINSKKVAVGQSNTRIKIKHKKAGNHYIKKIVHISAKTKDSPIEARYKDVEWSHRWEVRGHRRSLGPGKIGKDRSGNPTWIGCTWVRPHVKGPDDKDLIKKIRIKSFEAGASDA